jgi:hypothetical protein
MNNDTNSSGVVEMAAWPAGRPVPMDPDALLHPAEASYVLGVSVRSLEAWRVRGGGPPYLRISARAVRYRRSTLLAWAADRERSSTSKS